MCWVPCWRLAPGWCWFLLLCLQGLRHFCYYLLVTGLGAINNTELGVRPLGSCLSGSGKVVLVWKNSGDGGQVCDPPETPRSQKSPGPEPRTDRKGEEPEGR